MIEINGIQVKKYKAKVWENDKADAHEVEGYVSIGYIEEERNWDTQTTTDHTPLVFVALEKRFDHCKSITGEGSIYTPPVYYNFELIGEVA